MTFSLNHRLIVFLFAGILQAFAASVSAQEMAEGKGTITIDQDSKVDLLVSKHIQINQNRKGIEGFRIQIFFDSGTSSKIRAQSVYETFKSNYPETEAYLTFKAPNYKVRVGDFRTKLDAQRYLNTIIQEYPNAWVIEDIISLPDVE